MSCSTTNVVTIPKKSKTNICTLGEGVAYLKIRGKTDRADIAFKRSDSKWVFGVDTPLKGEQVFWFDIDGSASNSLKGLFSKLPLSLFTLIKRLFPLKNNTRNITDLELNNGVHATFSTKGFTSGGFKATLMRNVFFIKRTYAQLEFRVTECSKVEKFQVIKN